MTPEEEILRIWRKHPYELSRADVYRLQELQKKVENAPDNRQTQIPDKTS